MAVAVAAADDDDSCPRDAATSHGRFQQAITAYEMALRIRPGMPQAVEALKRARARIAPTGG